MEGKRESESQIGARPLEYTRLRGRATNWIEWREDENGITFVERPKPTWLVAIVGTVAFACAVLFMLVAAAFGLDTSDPTRDARWPGFVAFGSLAVASAAFGLRTFRAARAPSRLRIDRAAVTVITPSALGGMRVRRIPRDRVYVRVATASKTFRLQTRRSELKVGCRAMFNEAILFSPYPDGEVAAVADAIERVVGIRVKRVRGPA